MFAVSGKLRTGQFADFLGYIANVPGIHKSKWGGTRQLAAPAFETRPMAEQWALFAWCKDVRPGHLVQHKIRLTESGTDLTTILRFFLGLRLSTCHESSYFSRQNIPGHTEAIQVMHNLSYLEPLAGTRGEQERRFVSWIKSKFLAQAINSSDMMLEQRNFKSRALLPARGSGSFPLELFPNFIGWA